MFWPYRGQLVILGLVVIVMAVLGVRSLLLVKPVFNGPSDCRHTRGLRHLADAAVLPSAVTSRWACWMSMR